MWPPETDFETKLRVGFTLGAHPLLCAFRRFKRKPNCREIGQILICTLLKQNSHYTQTSKNTKLHHFEITQRETKMCVATTNF